MKIELGFEVQTKGGDQKEARGTRTSKSRRLGIVANQSIRQILKLMGQAEGNGEKQRRADQSSDEKRTLSHHLSVTSIKSHI